MLYDFSVYLASGLGTIFGRFNLPAFNLPFCVAAFMFLGALSVSQPNEYFPLQSQMPSNDTLYNRDIEWEKVKNAVIRIFRGLKQLYVLSQFKAQSWCFEFPDRSEFRCAPFDSIAAKQNEHPIVQSLNLCEILR